jgi:hypothetical protein
MVRDTLAARWLFTTMVAAALAFGARQAVAAPAGTDERAQVCNARLCDRICRAIGAFGGTCTPDGSCVCFIR